MLGYEVTFQRFNEKWWLVGNVNRENTPFQKYISKHLLKIDENMNQFITFTWIMIEVQSIFTAGYANMMRMFFLPSIHLLTFNYDSRMSTCESGCEKKFWILRCERDLMIDGFHLHIRMIKKQTQTVDLSIEQ